MPRVCAAVVLRAPIVEPLDAQPGPGEVRTVEHDAGRAASPAAPRIVRHHHRDAVHSVTDKVCRWFINSGLMHERRGRLARWRGRARPGEQRRATRVQARKEKATCTDGNANEEWSQPRTNGSGVRRRQAGARAPGSGTSRRTTLVCEKELAAGHLSAIFGRRREGGPEIAPSTRCRDPGAGFEVLPAYAVRRKDVVGRERPKRQHTVGTLA